MRLSRYGISVELPDGWEGRIYRRDEGDRTLHAANFPLPSEDGHFGPTARPSLGAPGVFIALTEYGRDAAGTALFAARGVPRLRGVVPDPRGLLRTLPGQAGVQRFFTAAGRAFCVYVVVGKRPSPERLVGRADAVLRTLLIE